MKIIVPGRNPGDKKFECQSCGCCFLANEDDYWVARIDVLYGYKYRYLKCECPTCGWICGMEEPE